ncbi:Conserved TM helix repeat-containing protein [Fibrella aestuarina BUZ 2]|uniref:Conserved TM helix repeat-containing protein n=1 Tax=Fibrella aestuarina BUZ 2 TaxID=1166018 RepID=I0K475_9BACT|nr:mechanosensitive ion channel [Fibrella aestuarina]CCG98928.1 Conserved TM helix repeat-containing protein [Fibrella aestuarina BUZ 2]
MTPHLPNLYEILINTFRSLITQFVSFVPNLIGAIVVLAIGILVARVTASVVKKLLQGAGFDRLGDKLNEIDIIRQLQTEIKLSDIVSKVLYYFILLVFLSAATETLGIAAITGMVTSLVNFIPKLIAAAIMLQVGVLVADVLKRGVVSLCQSFGIASGRLLGMVVFFFFLIITIISALGQAGINTELLESSFNLLIGGIVFAFAIGYGFASRDVMANLVSSFYSKSRFKEGQIIRLDGITGRIVHVDATSLTLQTGESKTSIPMQLLQTKTIEFLES